MMNIDSAEEPCYLHDRKRVILHFFFSDVFGALSCVLFKVLVFELI